MISFINSISYKNSLFKYTRDILKLRGHMFTKENKATSKQSIFLNFSSYNLSEVELKDIPSTKFDQLPWAKTVTKNKGKKFSFDKKNSKEITTYTYLIEEIIKNLNQ